MLVSRHQEPAKPAPAAPGSADDQIAMIAAKIALTPKDKRSSKCWEIFTEVMWGEVRNHQVAPDLKPNIGANARPTSHHTQERSKHLDLKVYIVVGLVAVFLMAVVIDAMSGGTLKEHGIHPREVSSVCAHCFA